MHGYVASKISIHEGCRIVLCYIYRKTGWGGWVGGDKWGKISLMVLELRGNTVLQSLSLNCFYYTHSSGF